ncbi:MAG TPA: cysteine dioxygenase family protein [Pseudonocardiaceae bacterium]|nr:cysteine dioxygenase family protein [Pseudonocardiaceae bacterium]
MFAVPANTVALPAAPARQPVRTALDVARDRSRWAPLLRYDPNERFATLVEANADVETWLLSWLPGQHTDVHDHAGSAGAFTVVSGVLTETVFRADGPTTHEVDAGQTRVFGPTYTHQVRNLGVDPAVSIHVYRPHRPPM